MTDEDFEKIIDDLEADLVKQAGQLEEANARFAKAVCIAEILFGGFAQDFRGNAMYRIRCLEAIKELDKLQAVLSQTEQREW